ncbi:type II toxin-antitoxin system RelE/ParE family toxin [Candidatus Micrarchaeota archaeon]|nr:type II toxin-antitoxin system RelE/ParE family toxin [Candidatus Micrarchaeota archaeon]
MYEVRVASKPEKFLNRLQPDYKQTIKTRLLELKTNFFPRGARPLTGKQNCYRIRVGPFRIQYTVVDELKTILVYGIERRDEHTYR